MNNWTAETRQALDDYLAEVESLALSKGDDAQEIVSGLREHIIQEAVDEAAAAGACERTRSVRE